MKRPVHRAAPEPAGAYQQTAAASKGNAFCWLTWRPDPAWLPAPFQGRGCRDGDALSRKQTERIENLRALGIDPLHIAGLGSQRRYDEAKFAVQMPQRKAA